MKGLTSSEALERLEKYGLNTFPEEKHHPFLVFLSKFWAPVPWLLEIIILLEIFLGKYAEAWVIVALLLFNAAISFFEEGKAKNALRLLRSKLDVQTRVLRDGQWQLLSAQKVVPQDIICIRMGDIVPADAKILQGEVLIDQSALTGESLPVEPSVGGTLYAGSIVKRGETYAEVVSTGKQTYFGKTAEIMRSTKTPSHLQRTIFSIMKSLIAFDLVLIVCVFVYSFYQGFPLSELIPFFLLILVASVPVALPATYALSTSLGAIELAKAGVLVTRLSSIEEAAAMDVLCLDKTGTITKNTLHVSGVKACAPYSEDELLALASLACDEATQDPLDVAILAASRNCESAFSAAKRLEFIPFDPSRKCSEAIVQYQGGTLHVVKGAPAQLLKTSHPDLAGLAADGSRVLAVMAGEKNNLALVGLIALQDPPRETSKEAMKELHDLKVRVMMITGDGAETALSIARQVGMGANAISRDELKRLPKSEVVNSDVFYGVFPEDKFEIVQLLQKEGRICGMTGDGVNDGPALKKAEVGIAVSNATDVAKASASLVLTTPGLINIVEAVKTSRRIYQRMLTYTKNKIIKTLEISVLLSLGLVLFNDFIISQMLIVFLFFTNDFVTMSLATDRVSYSHQPDKWDVKKLMLVGGVFAVFELVFSFFILYAGARLFCLSIEELRTLVFLTLVFTGQATVYLVRERKHIWNSMPSRWMIGCTIADVVIIGSLAVNGVLMAALHPSFVFGLLASVAIYFVALDFLKIRVFSFLKL